MSPRSATGTCYRTFGGEGQMWFGAALTVGGVATFYPTDDGTSTGAPYFSSVDMIAHSATGAGSMTQVPLTSTKSKSTTKVEVHCLTGTVLAILGATVVAAPDGTEVTCLIWGKP